MLAKLKSIKTNFQTHGLKDYIKSNLSVKKTMAEFLMLSLRYRLVGLLYGKNLYPDPIKISQLKLLIEEYGKKNCKDELEKSLNATALAEQAFPYIVDGNFDKARSLLYQAEKLDPVNPNIFQQYSRLFRWEEGHYSHQQLDNIIKCKQLLENQNLVPYCFDPKTRFLTANWTIFVGHIGLLEFHIKARKLGLFPSENYRLITLERLTANKAYLSYFSDYIDIDYLSENEYWIYENCFKAFQEPIEVWKLKQGFVDLYEIIDQVQEQWVQKQLPPLLQIKNEHRENGLAILKQLSIPEGAWFVSLHVRGESKGFDEGDPQDGRNCDVFSYLPAIQAITEAGGYVFRMGHKGMAPLPDLPRVIDYANSPYKFDWMDVFLWSCCRFFIGTQSGPLQIPHSFGVPILYTNVASIGYGAPSLYRTLLIPKLWRSISEDRLLTFSEVLQSPAGWCERRKLNSDLVMVDNSPDEIEAGVREMLNLTNCHKGLPYYILNSSHPSQIKLDAIRQRYNVIGTVPVSQYFLEKHANLII